MRTIGQSLPTAFQLGFHLMQILMKSDGRHESPAREAVPNPHTNMAYLRHLRTALMPS